MLEVDVSRLIREPECDPVIFSASISEVGKDAGPKTWRAAVGEASNRPLLATDDERRKAKDYFRDFGAWDDDEIDGWSDSEVDALVLQEAAASLREAQSCCPGEGDGGVDWSEYERQSQAGHVSGSVYMSGADLFISLSH